MRITRGPRLFAAAALALGLLTGCGDDSAPANATVQSTAPPVVHDLASYDAYVHASAENNPLYADVYGIRFDPFTIDRITTGKRISSLGADAHHLVVAAADQDVDRLAQVTGAGDLLPVPGLGRPYAFQPKLVDGVMYYQDIDDAEREDANRHFAFDLKKQNKKLLFRSVEDHANLMPLTGGRLLYGLPKERGPGALIVRTKSGKTSQFPLKGYAGGAADLGRDWLAQTVISNDGSGEKSVDLVLLDPDTGKTKRVPGFQVIAWSPDGTRLLARRTDSEADSSLVVLDPDKLDAPIDVHTLPGLAIYGGAWVRGDATPAR